jgi:outer membrane protein TolC
VNSTKRARGAAGHRGGGALRRSAAVPLLGLFLALCAATTPPSAHAQDVQGALEGPPSDAGKAENAAELGTVTLQQCLEAAIQTGPDARLARVDLATAQTQLAETKARNAVGLSATARASHDSNPAAGSSSAFSSTAADTFAGGVQLTGPLSTRLEVTGNHQLSESSPREQGSSVTLSLAATPWDGYPGGKNRAAVQQATISLEEQRAASEADLKGLAYAVKQAYYAMLAEQRQLAVLEQTLSQHRQELERIRAQLEQGNATRIDLQQAQVNARAAELDLLAARDSLATSREKLSALVGWPLERQYAVSEVPDLAIPSLDASAAVARALSQRPELRQFDLQRASGQIDLALARSQASPSVSVSGGYTLSTDWSAEGDSSGWSAGVQVSVPLVDSGVTAAQKRQASLQMQSLEIRRRQLADDIATQVREAINALRDLLARAELAAQSLQLARDQYELADIQYQSGVISTLDLLEASVTLTTAEVNLARSRSDIQLGVLALQAAAGD